MDSGARTEQLGFKLEVASRIDSHICKGAGAMKHPRECQRPIARFFISKYSYSLLPNRIRLNTGSKKDIFSMLVHVMVAQSI